ncbi:MAG: hypothetical protein CSA47_01760 [Gammaproteobacteria bacterium]|nr:MAG: hypothetical protein CSA47_01760 [Gammaproteobacteria bacterium]
MSDLLPKRINPWLLYRHHEVLQGTVALVDMPNLLASQLRKKGHADVSLSVVRREDGQIVLTGQADVALTFACQRCLQPLEHTFAVPFELVLVKYDSQLESVNDEDDAIVCEESLLLAPLIEQELILALPMIVKHDSCKAMYEYTETDEAKHQRPFANLKDLLS